MANKFLNVLSDKIIINENKLTINTSGLGLTSNTAYDIDFPNGSIKDLNNNNFRSIDLFKLSTGESSGPAITTLPSGRKIYRHESDEASVLIFDRYGTEVHLLIPDCKYRTSNSNLRWGIHDIDTTAPNLDTTNKNNTTWIDGGSSNITNDATIPVMTDAQLQELYPQFSTDLSAKQLCDIWISYQENIDTTANPPIIGVPVVEYARELTIPHITGNFDIPNMYELMVMFFEQEAIDNLDKYKSDSQYQNYLLARNSWNNRWFGNNKAWSSSETFVSAASATYICGVNYNGRVANLHKSSTYDGYIAPVKELSSGETGYTSEIGSTGSTGETPTPAVIIPGATLLPSGRQIYRHESDEASVLVFDMYGTEVRLLIPDCKYRYRSAHKWGVFGTDTAAPNFTIKNRKNGYYVAGDPSKIENNEIPVVTDAQLQHLWPSFSTDLSAKELCNIWMTYQGTTDNGNPKISGVPAVNWARSLVVRGITGNFDIPNAYELMVIYLEQEAIDNLDKYKSDSQYKDRLLAKHEINNNYRWFYSGVVWSSSEYSNNYVWSVSGGGSCSSQQKNLYDASILPVRELSSGETGFTGETEPAESIRETAPTIIPSTTTTLSSGRKIYRHESDEASVLIFDRYGTEVHLLIPDCKYRTILKWGADGIDTVAPNFGNYNKNDTWMIDGGSSSIKNDATIPVMTDAELQDIWPNFSTDLSAKDLCDIWITYQGIPDLSIPPTVGVPAVEYARNLTISGITGNFDIPNVYELMVIYLEQEAIDSLDKYKSDPTYQNYLLARNSSNKRWFNNNYVWAASEYSNGRRSSVWTVNYTGSAIYNQTLNYGMMPVQELTL